MAKKKSKRHIGVELSIPFDPSIHNPGDTYYDQQDGIKRVKGIDWMINRVRMHLMVTEPFLLLTTLPGRKYHI